MTNQPHPRSLTYDEKKAAEAAFACRPFNEAWSVSARQVYDGIMKVLPNADLAVPTPSVEASTGSPPADRDPVQAQETFAQENVVEQELGAETATTPALHDREQAIQAGTLIDVTSTAQQLGISFHVTITRPLWEMGIVTNQSLSEEDQTSRLRDILMAFRLRIARLTTISPLLDFPALLALPPSTVPQPVPLFALVQPDHKYQAIVTLLLPNEVSLSIIPTN
jgi:hypothetical protein